MTGSRSLTQKRPSSSPGKPNYKIWHIVQIISSPLNLHSRPSSVLLYSLHDHKVWGGRIFCLMYTCRELIPGSVTSVVDHRYDYCGPDHIHSSGSDISVLGIQYSHITPGRPVSSGSVFSWWIRSNLLPTTAMFSVFLMTCYQANPGKVATDIGIYDISDNIYNRNAMVAIVICSGVSVFVEARQDKAS